MDSAVIRCTEFPDNEFLVVLIYLSLFLDLVEEVLPLGGLQAISQYIVLHDGDCLLSHCVTKSVHELGEFIVSDVVLFGVIDIVQHSITKRHLNIGDIYSGQREVPGLAVLTVLFAKHVRI